MLKFFHYQNFISSAFKKYWWLTPVLVFFVWRIILEAVGDSSFSSHFLFSLPRSVWWQWDSNWYGRIVHSGYSWHPGVQSDVTFFPLYPLLWRIILSLTGWPSAICAQLISNLFALGSFIIFYYWVLLAYDKNIALRALLALAIFPTSFFLISIYSESTLLILVAAAFLLAHKEKWVWAAVVAALASAARPPGIFLWPMLLWLWYNHPKKKGDFKRGELFSLSVLPPLGLIIFSLYLWHQLGDPWLWFKGQANYGRSLGVSPFVLVGAYIKHIILMGENWSHRLAELVAILFVGICLPKIYRLNPAYAFFILLNLAPSFLSNTFTSVQRFVLILLPVFIVVAMQKKIIYHIYILICAGLLIFNILLFVNGYWVG